jgi:hypothetical protein
MKRRIFKVTKKDNAPMDNDQLDRELRRVIRTEFSKFEMKRSVSDRVLKQIEEEEKRKARGLLSRIKQKIGSRVSK